MPMPNYCIECDKPLPKDSTIIECDICKEKLLDVLIEKSNCCSAPFTYPGFPDSDICSKCYEHADIWEEDDE